MIIISESFSLYYLILFYYALKKPLEPHRPLLKFLIIKITLFFTFWQNLTLNIFEEEIAGCFETNEDITEEILLSSIEVGESKRIEHVGVYRDAGDDDRVHLGVYIQGFLVGLRQLDWDAGRGVLGQLGGVPTRFPTDPAEEVRVRAV